ncbi:MAG TPA: HNH endonuclease signature motif containing protein [Candidatus Dormibacteraeota bacterium]|nr:HNH endonuclease signature motif containing protein [Candidatus Dormibacteraeota bacterium]
MNETIFHRSCLNGCGRKLQKNAKRYCSFKCEHAHRHACRARAFILQGGVKGHVPLHFLGRVLREFYGECCVQCGWAERHKNTGRVPVEVEHIDGDWRNNRLENLILLCPNCHALTPTFRGLNRGKGRAHRRGGRENPIGPRMAALTELELAINSRGVQRVIDATATAIADVAERLKAPSL